jgi:hypothetical protein
MDAETWRMFCAITRPCGHDALISDAPLRAQRPEPTLPPNATELLREALTGERAADSLPADASARMRAVFEGGAR